MFRHPASMNKRVGLFGPTRFGNSPSGTNANFRWRSGRARGGEGPILRTLRAGSQSKRVRIYGTMIRTKSAGSTSPTGSTRIAIGVRDRSAAMLERAGSVPAAREMALRTRSRSARSARSKPSGSSSAHGLSAACSSRLVSESMTSAPDRASASPSSMRTAPMDPDSARTVRTNAVHFDGPAAHRPSARAATSRNSTR